MKLIDNNFKEILSSQLVCLIIGLISGTILAVYTDKLLMIPSMFILLPGFLEMRGNISGSFASRLSSGLFLGVLNKNKKNTKTIRGNLLASFILAGIVSLSLGVIAFLFNLLIFNVVMLKIIILPFIAGIIANTIEIILSLFTTFYLFNKGHDPNNIVGPFLTSTGDITSIISLILVALVIL